MQKTKTSLVFANYFFLNSSQKLSEFCLLLLKNHELTTSYSVKMYMQRATEKNKYVRVVKSNLKAVRHFKLETVSKIIEILNYHSCIHHLAFKANILSFIYQTYRWNIKVYIYIHDIYTVKMYFTIITIMYFLRKRSMLINFFFSFLDPFLRSNFFSLSKFLSWLTLLVQRNWVFATNSNFLILYLYNQIM